MGFVVFELVVDVVVGALTAGYGLAVTKGRPYVAKAMKGMHLLKLDTVMGLLQKACGKLKGGGKGQGLADALDGAADGLKAEVRMTRAAGWCFVAGTMILTAQGAVPIERVQVGDLVWSAHEVTGELGLRPVIELYRNVAEEIWTVRYQGEGEGAAERELECTGEHPFWSEDAGEFVAASELAPGARLRLFGGEVARVLSVTSWRGPPGSRTTVYNFAVAEHHTYFAGEGGVWVHNACDDLWEDVLGSFISLKNEKYKHLPEEEAFDLAQKDALAILRSQDKKLTSPNRTETGVSLFEQNPKILNGVVDDDVTLIQRFIDETGLQAADSRTKPASIARLGDGQQPYFGTPPSWSPQRWLERTEDLVADLKQLNNINESAGSLANAPLAVQRALKVANHSEAQSLLRMAEDVGVHGKVIDLTTGNLKVCGHCINKSGSGLAEIVRALGIKKLKLRSEKGFADSFYEGADGVTIIYDEINDVVSVVLGIVD